MGIVLVLLVDMYLGVDVEVFIVQVCGVLLDWMFVDVEVVVCLVVEVEQLIVLNFMDDWVFGVMSYFMFDDFYDVGQFDIFVVFFVDMLIVVIGWGVVLFVLCLVGLVVMVLVDMVWWEIQLCQWKGVINWCVVNFDEDNFCKYKCGFFVEWWVVDCYKCGLFDMVDFVFDGNVIVLVEQYFDFFEVGMIIGVVFCQVFKDVVYWLFCVVLFFDFGVWGGQWMKNFIGFDFLKDNYVWCFDCVFEENFFLFEGEGGVVEIFVLDLVFSCLVDLFGLKIFFCFGVEFLICFDFFDIMDGGNFSLQVYLLIDYIQNMFGMYYMQDESYYMFDVGDDVVVYFGIKEGIDCFEMLQDFVIVQDGEYLFFVDKYINLFLVCKYDYFVIFVGIVYCFGVDFMVLEILVMLFIFIFKFWDWGWVGFDGILCFVYFDYGVCNIQWDCDISWVGDNFFDWVEIICMDGDVIEESMGLYEFEFIEVCWYWFFQGVDYDIEGIVNVFNLVEGDEVRVVSFIGVFEFFMIYYVEMFIVLVVVGVYWIECIENVCSICFVIVKVYVCGLCMSDN